MYFSKDQNLKIPFPGSSEITRNFSQAYQDIFVLMALKGKRGGFFLEIGASDPVFINNTFLLESQFDWRGVAIDINPKSVRRFARKRKSKIVEADALQLDYSTLLKASGAPRRIDYLQVDIDPSIQSLRCLMSLPLEEYRFSVITYETDFYDPSLSLAEKTSIRDQSRELLHAHGYLLLGPGIATTGPLDVFEDWWIDPNAVDQDVVDRLYVESDFDDSAERFLTGGPHTLATEFYLGQGLGNQLWSYAVTRALAERRGMDFSVIGSERFKGSEFMNLDFGVATESRRKSREGRSPKKLPKGFRFHKRERKVVSARSGLDVSGCDESLFSVPINTVIDGNFQSFSYFAGYEQKVRSWIQVKADMAPLDEKTCVIHVRAGDFVGIPHLKLTSHYFNAAIKYLSTTKNVTHYVCVSDQPEIAERLLPESVDIIYGDGLIDPRKAAHHFGGPVGDDFLLLLTARHLILSNSSFSWWGAFLNPHSPFVIAPKFWANYGGTTNDWSTADIVTPGFHYMNRDGAIQTYEECLYESRQALEESRKVVTDENWKDLGHRPVTDAVREQLRPVYGALIRSLPSSLKR